MEQIFNFNNKFNDLLEEIKKLKADYKLYKKETTKFLKECHKYGIHQVSIGVATQKIPESLHWGGTNSVITDATIRDSNDNPAIWTVVNNLGIGGCVSNNGQYYVSEEARLIEGVYEFKNGRWRIIN